uniref:Gem-associated protein 2 n=2 Tax=Lygus hesperus TaxID=30085 RepID=A0A0A9WBZ2_LYGHE
MSDCGEEEDDVLLDTAWAINDADLGNYDAQDLPTNGHQYLHRVMKEAESLPVIVVADVNRKRFESKQNVYVAQLEVFDIPEKYLPTRDWQNQQEQDFEKTRRTLSKMRCRRGAVPDFKIPDVIDPNDEWFDFIWKTDIKEPVLHLMLAFNQPSLDRLLHLFKRWLEEDKIHLDSNVCLWLYSIFACLEIPLLPSTFSALRSLAQLAIKQRARMVQNEESLDEKEIAHFNLLICIVGRYFKQTDLADKY